jgi:GntR family transcriptional regulator
MPVDGSRAATTNGNSPKYVRIVQDLTRRLAAREWRAGELLPSEGALAREYGVSHGTARKAIDRLVIQNIVTRQQGKGTFVATHDWRRALFHFFRLVRDDGSRALPTPHIISREYGSATEREAERLRIRRGAKVWRVRRVRSFEKPTIFEILILPAGRFPRLDIPGEGQSPPLTYEYYSKEHGINVISAEERLRAVKATALEAKMLELEPGMPLLEIDRIAFDINEKPIEWRLSRCDTRQHYYLSFLS